MKFLILPLLLFITIVSAIVPIGLKQPQVDLVYIIDEKDLLNTQIQKWLVQFASQVEIHLTSAGYGTQNTSNNYGIVLFGGQANDTSLSISVNDEPLFSIAKFHKVFPTILRNLTANGSHDGYAAMDRALSYPFRSDSSRVFMFISSFWREIKNADLTKDMLLDSLREQNIILNVIVNTSFALPNILSPFYPEYDEKADNASVTNPLGMYFIDNIRRLYYVNQTSVQEPVQGAQMYRVGYTMEGRIDGEHSQFTTVDDYVYLASELSSETCRLSRFIGSTAFDIKTIIKAHAAGEITIWNEVILTINSLSLILNNIAPLRNQLNASSSGSGASGSGSGSAVSGSGSGVSGSAVSGSAVSGSGASGSGASGSGSAHAPNCNGVFQGVRYFISSIPVSSSYANEVCKQLNGQLTAVSPVNTAFISALSKDAVWIDSWEGDNYVFNGLVYIRGSVTIATEYTELHPALCSTAAHQNCSSSSQNN